MKAKKLLLLIAICTIFSFTGKDNKLFKFNYPKTKGTDITLSAGHFSKFTKEWREADYYYSANGDGFICSVLYYKLNDEEKLSLVEEPKKKLGWPDSSPAYPFTYFTASSNMKEMESNNTSWGSPSDDFMFNQNDVIISGTKLVQKNMYGYCMFTKELFVKIHLSKLPCSPSDSLEMVGMLKSLVKVKP